MRLGIADHLGWAVAITASDDHEVVDRRRIELIAADLSAAPVHYDRGRSDDAAVAALIAAARESIARLAAAAFDELPAGITAVSLRTWPPDFSTDVATLRRPPHEAKADAIMYRQVLAEVAGDRGWAVHRYAAKTVLGEAAARLGDRADEVIDGPRARLGPPWTKDHRLALAATIVAGG